MEIYTAARKSENKFLMVTKKSYKMKMRRIINFKENKNCYKETIIVQNKAHVQMIFVFLVRVKMFD